VVTSLDHDANIRPWVRAAERAGAKVRWAEFDPQSGELDPAAFDSLLSERTRLVAVTRRIQRDRHQAGRPRHLRPGSRERVR